MQLSKSFTQEKWLVLTDNAELLTCPNPVFISPTPRKTWKPGDLQLRYL